MPEPYWPKRKSSFTLSDAAKNSRYAKMRCRYCKTARYYLLEELRVAFGNIECDDVVYQSRWRCTSCNELDMLDLSIENPSAADLQKVNLIAGRHRLHAAQELGWTDIPANVVTMDDVAAELAMISENLHRADLTALQRDEQVARWIELTDSKASQPATVSKGGRGNKEGINAASRELGIKKDSAHSAVKVAASPRLNMCAVCDGGMDERVTRPARGANGKAL